MAKRKREYPCPGVIRDTGDKVTILSEQVAPGGLKTYAVKFESGHVYEWSREKVKVGR